MQKRTVTGARCWKKTEELPAKSKYEYQTYNLSMDDYIKHSKDA